MRKLLLSLLLVGLTPQLLLAQDADADARKSSRRAGMSRRSTRVKLDFEKTPIQEVVETISEMTGKNFILPDNIRGNVTILSPQSVSPAAAYAAFIAALEANNLAVYRAGSYYKIVPKKDAQRGPVPVVIGNEDLPWSEQMVTYIFRLQHVEAEQVNNILKGLVSRDGEVQIFPPDLLIITETGLNIRRIKKILGQIDRSSGASEIRVVQARYASAEDIAKLITEVFGNDKGARANPRQPQKGGEDQGVTLGSVIADERTNKLIIIADERSFQKIQELINEIDVPTEGEGQIHVHYLANANSEELASTLSQLVSSSNQAAGSGASHPSPRAARAPSSSAAR